MDVSELLNHLVCIVVSAYLVGSGLVYFVRNITGSEPEDPTELDELDTEKQRPLDFAPEPPDRHRADDVGELFDTWLVRAADDGFEIADDGGDLKSPTIRKTIEDLPLEARLYAESRHLNAESHEPPYTLAEYRPRLDLAFEMPAPWSIFEPESAGRADVTARSIEETLRPPGFDEARYLEELKIPESARRLVDQLDEQIRDLKFDEGRLRLCRCDLEAGTDNLEASPLVGAAFDRLHDSATSVGALADSPLKVVLADRVDDLGLKVRLESTGRRSTTAMRLVVEHILDDGWPEATDVIWREPPPDQTPDDHPGFHRRFRVEGRLPRRAYREELLVVADQFDAVEIRDRTLRITRILSIQKNHPAELVDELDEHIDRIGGATIAFDDLLDSSPRDAPG